MINVIVTYRVNPQFVSENKANINKFLEDFDKLDNSKFSYSVFFNKSENTFIHISNYADEEIQHELLNVPSFLKFQQKRDESGLDGSHKVQILEHIGSTKQIF